MSSKVASGFRMWMPTMPMTLVGATNATATKNATATFRVLPKMTKHEISEYLQKIYNLPVKKVNTDIKRIFDEIKHKLFLDLQQKSIFLWLYHSDPDTVLCDWFNKLLSN